MSSDFESRNTASNEEKLINMYGGKEQIEREIAEGFELIEQEQQQEEMCPGCGQGIMSCSCMEDSQEHNARGGLFARDSVGAHDETEFLDLDEWIDQDEDEEQDIPEECEIFPRNNG